MRDFDSGRASRLTFAALTLAFVATSRYAACCQHLAKVYDAAHPRARRKK